MTRRKRIPRAVIGAGLLVLAAALWVSSGVLTRAPAPPDAPAERAPMRVATATLEAVPVQQVLTLQGSLEPSTVTVVRAETASRIEALLLRRGSPVKAGQPIARLARGEREAQLRRAQATLAQAQRDLDATRQLAKEGFMPHQKVDSALAQVRAAEAELEGAKLDLSRTQVLAPIDGILSERIAEAGEWVGVGDPIAEIVQNDPVRAIVHVPQRHIQGLAPGASAQVRLLNSEPRAGTVVTVDAVADRATRTFRVEIEIPNPGLQLPSGVSVQAEIPTATVSAHKISPALLRLSDDGKVGVMAIDEQGRAQFHRIEIVRTEADGLWVAGLPARLQVITAGHSFVRDGEPVLAVEQ